MSVAGWCGLASLVALSLLDVPASAQTTGTIPPAACANFAHAQNAAYGYYIRMVVGEIVDPRRAPEPDKAAQQIDEQYRAFAEAAVAGDLLAGRKAIALELFAMQVRRQPAADMSQRKLCLLANEKLPDQGVADALACAVASLDGARRDAGGRELARRMVEQARALIPPDANASDPRKLHFEDVSKGLAGCI